MFLPLNKFLWTHKQTGIARIKIWKRKVIRISKIIKHTGAMLCSWNETVWHGHITREFNRKNSEK